jgi:hypothetical protein
MPIIPTCESAISKVPVAKRATITQARLDNVVKWRVRRLQAVAKLKAALLEQLRDVISG